MSNVRFARFRAEVAPGGGPPYDGDMHARITKLEALAEKSGERLGAIENRLTRIEAKQDEFTKHYATRADLTEAKNSIIVWVVAAVFLAQLLPVVAGLIKHYFP